MISDEILPDEFGATAPKFTLQEQRAIIKYFYYSGKSPIDIQREMTKVCPLGLMNVKNIRLWVRKFREGRDSTINEKPGRKMSLENKLKANKRLMEVECNRGKGLERLILDFLPELRDELGENSIRQRRRRRRLSEKLNDAPVTLIWASQPAQEPVANVIDSASAFLNSVDEQVIADVNLGCDGNEAAEAVIATDGDANIPYDDLQFISTIPDIQNLYMS